MSAIRDACRDACDSEEMQIPLEIIQGHFSELQREVTEIDCTLQRTAVQLHFLMMKIRVCMDQLEHHCELR